MQIKDLIATLEALYNTYDNEYKSIAGEPEIMIDVFGPVYDQFGAFTGYSEYKGFSGNIVIEKSRDGVYDILSSFNEDHNQEPKASQSASSSLPSP